MSTNESETRARTMGWLPKDQYKGPEEHWVDAEAYLKRGDEILPILQANNKRLSDRVTTAEASANELRAQLTAAQEAIEELKSFKSTINKDRVKDQKTEILAALANAKREGDVDAEVRLTDQLSELNAALKAPAEAPKPVTPPTVAMPPAARQWMAENPWFGNDKRKTALAMAISEEFKASGGILGTPEHFAHVDREVGQMFDTNANRRESPSKVEGGNGGASRGSGGKTFADLPPEAQAACKRSADKLVGPNRAYKTLGEWQKRYLELYDWS